MRPSILILDHVHQTYEEELALFRTIDAEVVLAKHPDPSVIEPLLPRIDALCVNLARVDEIMLSKLERCRIVARYGVGYDNVDVEAAARRGVWVSNCRHYCDEETSDQAMGLLLAAVRAIPRRDAVLKQGGWTPAQADSGVFRLKGKTFAVVGYGGSGEAMVRKLRGFQPGEILVVDPTEDPEVIRSHGGRKADLEEAFRLADVLSFHVPLNARTRHMVRRETIASMKPGAVLVNVSRGGVFHTGDVIEALQAGRLGAVGLDVFEEEPLPASHPLRSEKNAVLSDHLGWYSRESFSDLKTLVARNVLEVLAGRPPLFPVNSPLAPLGREAR